MTEPRIEYLPISGIKVSPKNPKTHDIPALTASIRRFGFTVPLIMDEGTGGLVAGHGRLEALRAIQASGSKPPRRILVKGKEWLVPVIRGLRFKNESEAEAYLIADNRLVEAGGWDRLMLAGLLKILRREGDELEGLGYSTSEADRLISRVASEKAVGDKNSSVKEDRPAVDETYMAHAIRQVVLFFTADEFKTILDRLSKVMKVTGARNHTEAFGKLLERWEADHA